MSLTRGERQALTWLLAVIGVGTGVRVAGRFSEGSEASPVAREALRRQLVAVDSAQRSTRRGSGVRRSASGRGRPPAARRSRRDSTSAPTGVAPDRQVPTLQRVDLDQADSVALERLPRIGPSLASRIVADRQQRGPFGSLEALQRVRGIGPKLAEHLAAYVTFSGSPRPSAVLR
jgi:competence protein ComEA